MSTTTCEHPREVVGLREREQSGKIVFDWECSACGASGTDDDYNDEVVCDHCNDVVTRDSNGYWVAADGTSDCPESDTSHEVDGSSD